MEIDPLETSDEARLWGLRILQKLESNSRGEGLARSEFPEPEFPFWSIAVAKELAENWENYAADLTNAAREVRVSG